MALIDVKGNLLDQGYDVVIHSCNCLNIMGGGIAKEVKKRFPEAFEADKNFKLPKGEVRLGHYSYAEVVHDKTGQIFKIVNIYGQHLIHGNGPLGDGVLTEYDKLEKGLRDSISYIKEKYDVKTFGVPRLIGCGLAKGNWKKVTEILISVSNDLNVDIYVSEFTP